MFDRIKAKKFGYEQYGKIVKVEDFYPLLAHPGLPIKKISIEYCVNDMIYQYSQVIHNVLKTYEKSMQVGNYIRVMIHKEKPEIAFIHEYEQSEYDL